jgi:hypothetical protein
MTVLPYLFARLTRGDGEGFSQETTDGLRALQPRYRELFPLSAGRGEVLLFRLAQVAPSVHRSRRRSLDEVLFFAEA